MLTIEAKFNKKSTVNDVMAKATLLNGRRISFGYPHGVPVAAPSRRGSGHKPYKDIEEVRKIMTWQEKGTQHIFPRPFFGPMMEKKHDEIESRATRLMSNVLHKDKDVDQEFSDLGFYLAEKTQEQIRDRKAPLLKPATVKRKRSKLLLRDTWAAYNSVTFKLSGKASRPKDIIREIPVMVN
jgi:hypothetical protein